MKFRTSWRSGCARWAFPFAAALSLFYYFIGNAKPPATALGYAPTITSAPILTLYAFAYAFSMSLAAWESGRLRNAGIWSLAPARSRYRVAANTLLPVLITSWTILVLPTVLALAETTTLPTLDSLRLLSMALLLCIGHAVCGFAVGLRVSPVIAAPVLAVATWVAVAFTWTIDPPWIRHVSGQYATDMMFGEVPRLVSLLPPILLTGGIAAGAALLWSPLRSRIVRGLLACSIAVAGPVAAYSIARDWSYNPPLLTGQAAARCLGEAPRICMPEVTAHRLPQVREDIESTLRALKSAGVTTAPELITDRFMDGRFSVRSTTSTWHLSLTRGASNGTVRYQVVGAAVRFPCSRPHLATARPALLWAAEVAGQGDAFRERMLQERDGTVDNSPEALARVEKVVSEVQRQSAEQQAKWYRSTIAEACGEGT
ncbi:MULTISPECIES: DUF7224 domain-containing protein [unclassified Streptomyces]|uniref:DUF7224 domain-containing protein n=1 Tax=unclassified Streptomyces TaxID=2593676 RepID=UPI002E76E46A|nr:MULTISPECIES: hypothetical protein [unclassified Streptomyces]MEE1766039.1 hypothetical protein [Streptomyces sp. SP18BB07]MEE1834817.1 hypothetical protein [Streptomyces sp. SP17KL33]